MGLVQEPRLVVAAVVPVGMALESMVVPVGIQRSEVPAECLERSMEQGGLRGIARPRLTVPVVSERLVSA